MARRVCQITSGFQTSYIEIDATANKQRQIIANQKKAIALEENAAASVELNKPEQSDGNDTVFSEEEEEIVYPELEDASDDSKFTEEGLKKILSRMVNKYESLYVQKKKKKQVTSEEKKPVVVEEKNLIEVKGKIVKLCSNGQVLVNFMERRPDVKLGFTLVQLEGLEFYTGTDFVAKLLAAYPSWLQNEELSIQLDTLSFTKAKKVTVFQDLPHGRVNMNVLTRNKLWKLYQSDMYLDLKYRRAKFVRCDPHGVIFFQLCTPFTEKILTYFQDEEYPQFETETYESLLGKGPRNKNIYVAPHPAFKSLWRIKVCSVVDPNLIRVEYIDLTQFEDIPIKNIFNAYKIDVNFSQFPPLCFDGHLKGIVSVDIDRALPIKPNQIIEVRLSTLKRKDVFAQCQSPDVYVKFQDEEGQWIDFNKLLVKGGFSVKEVLPRECIKAYGAVYTEERSD